MKTTTKEIIDMKVGELNLSVPYTTDGLRAVRGMVAFLEAEVKNIIDNQRKKR
jgi:hypothetical protein